MSDELFKTSSVGMVNVEWPFLTEEQVRAVVAEMMAAREKEIYDAVVRFQETMRQFRSDGLLG